MSTDNGTAPSSAVPCVRPRPASKIRRCLRPTVGRTAWCRSVPSWVDPGRTGRLKYWVSRDIFSKLQVISTTVASSPGFYGCGGLESIWSKLRNIYLRKTMSIDSLGWGGGGGILEDFRGEGRESNVVVWYFTLFTSRSLSRLSIAFSFWQLSPDLKEMGQDS